MRDIPCRIRGQHRLTGVWLVCFMFSIFISIGLSAILFRQQRLQSVLVSVSTLIPQALFGLTLYLRIRNKRITEKKMTELLLGTTSVEASDALTNPPTGTLSDTSTHADGCAAIEISEAERDIAVRSSLIRPVFKELCSSVSHSLSSTTEPISFELLHIRKTIQEFLESILVYEDEVKNRTTLSHIESESNLFNRDLASLSETVEEVFSLLDERIASLKTVSEHIGGISGDIGEISEKIRILSFNASIEAARAGSLGKGFRVIAGEIKKLSSDTDTRLVEIRETLKETRNIFKKIGSGLTENRNRMLDVVVKRQRGFGTLEHILQSYFPRLENLYTSVTSVINSLSKSMETISPVVQLHEITSQEIGNLDLVADDFCKYIEEKISRSFPTADISPEPEDAGKTATVIRNRLTTEKELRALEKGIKGMVPDADINLGINNCGIELF